MAVTISTDRLIRLSYNRPVRAAFLALPGLGYIGLTVNLPDIICCGLAFSPRSKVDVESREAL